MKRIITLISLLIISAASLLGCSSNTSSSSGFGSGSGYSLNLTVSNSSVPEGGSVTCIVAAKDAQGNPVNDSVQGITFSSTLGGTFSPVSPFLSSGVATAVYTAPGSSTTTTTAAIGITQITASYKGAFAYQSIQVFKP
jgi:predicted small secreted protein